MDVIALRDGRVLLDQAVVIRGGATAVLTPIEQRLLQYLALCGERCVSRSELLVEVWGYRPGVHSRTIDNTVRRLREKIEIDPANPAHLIAVYGRGLRLQVDAPPSDLVSVGRSGHGLVGRDRERAEILAAWAAGRRAVALVGPAGAGKTCLASELAAARRAVDPDAVTVVTLAGAAHDGDGATLVARALDALPADPARLGSALHGRGDHLLVLDGADAVADWVADAVPRWLAAAPELRILATSRAAIEGAARVDVGPLSEDDAVALFLRRAHGAPAEDADVRALVRGLDRLPLAIELAAARVGVLSVPAMVARLDRRLDLIDAEGAMRAAIDGSLADLDAETRRSVADLAVFAGDFTLDDAEAVTGDTGALERVHQLADRGMLRVARGDAHAEPRFSLFACVRDRVREVDPPTEDALRRHAGWYGRWLGRFGDPLRLTALRAGFVELRAAMDRLWTVDPPLAAACALAVLNLLLDDGPLPAARALCVRLRGLPLPDDLRAELLRCEATIEIEYGRTDGAVERVERALALASDPDRAVMLRLVRIQAWKGGGQLDEAARALDALAADLGRMPDWLAARVHLNAGFVAILRGDLASGERELLAARAGAREVGELKIDAYAADLLSALLAYDGRLGEAALVSAEAIRGAGSRRNEALCTQQLGCVELARGRIAEAEAAFDRAEALHHTSGNAQSILVLSGYRAQLLGQCGRPDQGEALLLAELNRGPRHPSQAWLWESVCELRILADRLAEARIAVDTALALADEGGFVSVRSRVGGWLALCLAHAGDLDGARRAIAVAAPVGRMALTKHLAVRAYLEARWGDPDRAAALRSEAGALAASLALGPMTAQVQWIERSRGGARPRLVAG